MWATSLGTNDVDAFCKQIMLRRLYRVGPTNGGLRNYLENAFSDGGKFYEDKMHQKDVFQTKKQKMASTASPSPKKREKKIGTKKN